jgi:hypothetical protein
MAARPGRDSRKFPQSRSPINGIWLGVSADSLREALHPTEYEARTFLGGGEGRSSLVWSCAVMVLGSRSPWGYLEKNKVASVMVLGSRSPWGYLGTNKNSFRHGPGSRSPQGCWKSKNSISASATSGLFWMFQKAASETARGESLHSVDTSNLPRVEMDPKNQTGHSRSDLIGDAKPSTGSGKVHALIQRVSQHSLHSSISVNMFVFQNRSIRCCAQQTGMHMCCGSTAYSVGTVYGGKGHLYTPGVRPALLATVRVWGPGEAAGPVW